MASTDASRQSPVAPPCGAVGEHRHFDLRPVQPVDVEDPACVEEISRGVPVDQGDEFAGHHFVQVQNRNAGGADAA